MQMLNRLIVMAGLLVGIIFAPISIVLALFFMPALADNVSNLGRGLAGGPSAALIQVICVIAALVIFLVSIILFFLELNRPTARHLRVSQVTDGQVQVMDDAIVQRLEQTLSQIADVITVKPRVVAGKKGATVDAFIELATSSEVNVPQKTQEVIAATKQVMEQQMGLTIGKVTVQLNYAHKDIKKQGA